MSLILVDKCKALAARRRRGGQSGASNILSNHCKGYMGSLDDKGKAKLSSRVSNPCITVPRKYSVRRQHDSEPME